MVLADMPVGILWKKVFDICWEARVFSNVQLQIGPPPQVASLCDWLDLPHYHTSICHSHARRHFRDFHQQCVFFCLKLGVLTDFSHNASKYKKRQAHFLPFSLFHIFLSFHFFHFGQIVFSVFFSSAVSVSFG